MKKIIYKYKKDGLKSGNSSNCRKKYNGFGKYRDQPINSLWEEVMVFNPTKDFEYETIVEFNDKTK